MSRKFSTTAPTSGPACCWLFTMRKTISPGVRPAKRPTSSKRPGNPSSRELKANTSTNGCAKAAPAKGIHSSLRASISHQADGRGQELRPVGAGTHQDLDLARLEHGLKIHAEKAQLGTLQGHDYRARFPGRQIDLGKTFEFEHLPRDAGNQIARE